MSKNIEFYKKLSKIQLCLKVPKNHRNAFGNYNYRKAEDIQEAVKNIIRDDIDLFGLSLSCSDKIVMIGTRYYVESAVVLTDGETSVVVTASAREEESKKGMDGAQVTGAASSYARKYALNGMFALGDSEIDPDVSNTRTKDDEKKTKTLDETKNERILKAINLLDKCKSAEELKQTWLDLPPIMKGDIKVMAHKDSLKNKFIDLHEGVE